MSRDQQRNLRITLLAQLARTQAGQKKWVLAAGHDVSTLEPKRAFELEDQALAKIKSMGVKVVANVDKSGFQKIADPYLDKLAKELGPHADKVKTLIRSIQ